MGLKEREETTITIEAKFSMLKEVEETTTMTMNGINKLPDEMIHHILSFLPLKSAVSTSVLSKRWRHQWTFTPTLIFDRKTRISDIHHCLNQYRAKQLCHLKIDLKLDFVSSTDLEKEYISNIQQWIEFGVTRQVQHLVISVQYKSSQELFFKPPESLFHCQSIQYLGLVCRCILDPPSDFKGFPSLKKLLLMDGKVEVESIESIVTTSPSLTLARLWAIDRGSEDLKISFSLYRRRDVTVEDEIHIYSPVNFQIILPRNQHDVRLKNVLPSLLSLKSLSTVIQTFGGGPGQIISEWGSSMANLSQVRVLKVNSLFIQAIHAKWCLQKSRQVVFSSLKRLHICGKITMNFTLVALVNFLQNCPSLQSMEIDLREREQYEWVSRFMETEHIQAQTLNPDGSWLHHGNIPCLLSNLQTVTLNGFSSANVQQMALIQFLLENAIILDMINLQWIGGYNKKFTDECDYVGSKVSSYCRRSPTAKINLYSSSKQQVF